MIKVYQAKSMFNDDGSYQTSKDLNDYTLVAKVYTTSLDEAYRLTNSIDYYWPKGYNDIITPQVVDARSTSIGDILYNGMDTTFYRVVSCGFEII